MQKLFDPKSARKNTWEEGIANDKDAFKGKVRATTYVTR